MKVFEELNRPFRTEIFEDNTIFFDFGKHSFAVFEVEIFSSGVQNITLAVGEDSVNGRVNRNPGGALVYQEEKITVPSGISCLKMQMSHAGYNDGTLKLEQEAAPFRYAEIRGNVTVRQAWQRAFFGRFDDDASDFKSSSQNLDKIWEFCKYTMKATTPFGVFIDGNRERQAYEGDAYINQLGYFVCTSDGEIARNTVDRLLEYPTWPTEWRLSMIPIVHDYLLYTGDLTSVRAWYERLQENLLTEGINDAGLLNPALLLTARKSLGIGNVVIPIRDIVDWPVGERDGYEMGEVNLVPNCWQYLALCRMADLARSLNKSDAAAEFQKMAIRSRTAIRSCMLKNGLFVDNPQSEHTSLHSCIYPVLWGISEKDENAKILHLLQSKGMACSVFTAQSLLECCFENGLSDYGLDLITSHGKRSWNNMIDCGATIAMESWDESFKPNLDWSHPWGAAPGNIIIRHIAGIRPFEAGFRKFSVSPNPGWLQYFNARTPSPYGNITLEMPQPGKYVLSVPENTCAVYQGREYGKGVHVLS